VAANLEGTSASEVDREGYITCDNSGKIFPDIILIGTGSELFLCEGSPKKVRKEGRKIRVVSLVCWQLFNRQSRGYKEHVLPPRVSKRISIEAGSPMGWGDYAGREGTVMGVDVFGARGAYCMVLLKRM
jgi:transketolase